MTPEYKTATYEEAKENPDAQCRCSCGKCVTWRNLKADEYAHVSPAEYEFRIPIAPYADLKAAKAAAKVIQAQRSILHPNEWVDDANPSWHLPPDRIYVTDAESEINPVVGYLEGQGIREWEAGGNCHSSGCSPLDLIAPWTEPSESEEWQHFSRLFTGSEGFEPNIHDERAKELFEWFLIGACAQAAGKVNVTSIPKTEQSSLQERPKQ